MGWSNGALKATLGASGVAAAGLWWDWTEPAPKGMLDAFFLASFLIVMGPFLILVFIKPDEVSPRIFRWALRVAVAWYAVIVLGALGLMAWRGFQRADLILGPMLFLGVWPSVSISRAIR